MFAFVLDQAHSEPLIYNPKLLLQKSKGSGLAFQLVICKVAPAISLEPHCFSPAEGLAHKSFPAERQVLNRMEEIACPPLNHLSQAGAIINSDRLT